MVSLRMSTSPRQKRTWTNSNGGQVNNLFEDSPTSEDGQTPEDEHLSGSNKRTKSIKTRETANMEDLTEVPHECTEEVSPKDGEIYEWLAEVFCSSRGFEMGDGHFQPFTSCHNNEKAICEVAQFHAGIY